MMKSRIGKHPVPVPDGVQVTLDGQHVAVKGKLGALEHTVFDEVSVAMEDGRIVVNPRTQSRRAYNMWATSRTLINNMVVGVSAGFTKTLEISGVGYRAAVEGNDLVLQLGYSHPVRYPIPEGISIKCEKPTTVSISGYDKQRVGQVAAEIRGKREPEPFKGKGVRYSTETILRKEGKKK
jgi:large subunit ribosomal protein L6